MVERDSKQMIKLAREGKRISKIWREDFPQYDYAEIYFEVYGEGEKSSLGVRRKITGRLKKLADCLPQEQETLIEDIDELVWHLYTRYKASQIKLEKIRDVIDERGK